MFHRLSTKIVLYLSDQGAVQKANIDWCVYALENRLSSFFVTLIIFLFILPFTSPNNSLILMFSIIAIRRYSGGYHCKSELRCFLLSSCCVFGGVFIARYLASKNCVTLCFLLLLISYGILFLAPINLPELHLSKSELTRMRLRLKISSTCLLMVYLTLSFYNFQISAYGIVGYSIAALSVIVAKLTQKRRMLS